MGPAGIAERVGDDNQERQRPGENQRAPLADEKPAPQAFAIAEQHGDRDRRQVVEIAERARQQHRGQEDGVAELRLKNLGPPAEHGVDAKPRGTVKTICTAVRTNSFMPRMRAPM